MDLDVESRSDLTHFIDALGEKVVVLRSGRVRGKHRVSLELGGPLSLRRNKPTPDKCVVAFSKLIERLPALARRGWDRASLRRFDVGFQVRGGSAPGKLVAHLRAATVSRVADLNGEIAMTIHPASRELVRATHDLAELDAANAFDDLRDPRAEGRPVRW